MHVNTTFRLKMPSDNFYLYLGVGPKVEVLLNSKYQKGEFDIKLNPVLFGAVGELGFTKKIRKTEVGLNALYNLDFNKLGNSKNGNTNTYSYSLKNYSFLITFFVGLDLKML